jgi:glycosyltransferase involved in cell wall biosynthesis
MSKLKILYTIPNFNTAGSGKVVLDLIRGLNDEFVIEVACFSDKGEMFKVVQKEAHKVHLLDFAVPGKPYASLFKRISPIRKFFKENKFDLIHSWHYNDDWTEGLSARLSGIPYVFTKKSMSWGGKDWWLRSKLAKHIITINHDMNTEFYPGWKKAVYMPLGLDLNEYAPLQNSREAINDLPISTDDFVLMSVANMVPVKGIETAIEALYLTDNQRIKYVLVGSCFDDYRATLDGLIEKYNLTNHVFFVGKKANVKPFLAAADLFVIPTLNEGRKEGQPMAPIEAMACQRLVTGSKIPGVKDVLAEWPDLIFDAKNAHELSKILKGVYTMSAEERLEIASRMRKKAEDNYGMCQFIQGHSTLYHHLTKNV